MTNVYKCNCGADTEITNSRKIDGRVWRRRTCKECRKRFTTYEMAEEDIDSLSDDALALLAEKVQEFVASLNGADGK